MNTTKYTFDTVFNHERDPADAGQSRRHRSFSEAEVARLCEDARVEGRKQGDILAQEAIAAGANRAAEAVREAIVRMIHERQALLEDASRLALAIAQKLASAALTAFPHTEVEAALRQAMHEAIGEPRIVLRAAPKVAEALAPRVAAIAQEEAFEGKVQLATDPALPHADCRIEWRGGGAERASAAIESALEALIGRTSGAGSEKGAEHGKQ